MFRLNIGVSKKTYEGLFGEGHYDFAALDQLMPHPVYGTNHWVCVLNPSEPTFKKLKPLLAEAYDIAAQRIRNKKSRGTRIVS